MIFFLIRFEEKAASKIALRNEEEIFEKAIKSLKKLVINAAM
jgi:hypothetical protein